MTLRGHATGEGTLHYSQRFLQRLHPAHFRQRCGLTFSSIGMGTYLGAARRPPADLSALKSLFRFPS